MLAKPGIRLLLDNSLLYCIFFWTQWLPETTLKDDFQGNLEKFTPNSIVAEHQAKIHLQEDRKP